MCHLHLHCDLSRSWVVDVEVDLCTEGGVEGALDDWGLCCLSATLDDTVRVSPWGNEASALAAGDGSHVNEETDQLL